MKKEMLNPSFVHGPAVVSFEFSKEIGACRIVPEIELWLCRTSWKSDFLLHKPASLYQLNFPNKGGECTVQPLRVIVG